MLVKPGDKIPLNLELWDGATDKFVRAYLFDSALNPLGFKTLTHIDKGLYSDSTFTMPQGYLYAVYVVYNNAGFTMESAVHSRAEDLAEPFDAGGIIVKELTAEISSLSAEGQVTATILDVSIGEQEVTGSVDTAELSGTVSTPEVTGQPTNDSIEGTTVC